MKKILLIMAGLITAVMGLQQVSFAAESDWSVKTAVQALYGNYSGSVQRSWLVSSGLIVSADYLEQGGFSLAGNYTRLKFKTGSNINQQGFYANARYNVYFDALPGPISLRLDGHLVNNNDITGDTDKVKVIAPQISFMNYAKTFYADIGYARSSYQNNLNVDQFTPTLGFGFNSGSDWFQIKGFFIKPSNRLRAQNKSSTAAVDVKWSHWFAAGAWHGLEKMQLGGLFGERIYAVDNDAAAVYNLADIQRGSLSLALQWRLTESLHVMLMGGNERYLNNIIGNKYNNRFAYVDISKSW
ncbi:MAG: hypothetical protein Q9M16_07980 [Mariprofundus sp.]|nr:hypothetical protein [Mariprofundus sp.]